jgi:cytidylate kinase
MPGPISQVWVKAPFRKTAQDKNNSMPVPSIIAVDGPAASGKSTIAERLADELGYLYFDTGVMYRAVTLAALARSIAISNEEGVTRLASKIEIDVKPPSADDGRQYDVLIDAEDVTWDLRTAEVDANVSEVSAYPGVRAAMTDRQREIGLRGKVVMVGRDIGTVVLPEAELKIYLDATVEARAMRRYQECVERGDPVTYEQILLSLKERDHIDSTRETAPLRAAENAIIIDSTNMAPDEVFVQVLGFSMRGSSHESA